MGGYPDLNRKLTVPHTVVLPIELYPPLYCIDYYWFFYFASGFNVLSYFIKNKYDIMLEWFEHSIVNTKNLWLTD